jgi:hypothetical protein
LPQMATLTMWSPSAQMRLCPPRLLKKWVTCAGKSKNCIANSNSWLEPKNANVAKDAHNPFTSLVAIMPSFLWGQGKSLGKTHYQAKDDLLSDYLRAKLATLRIHAFMPI